MPVLKNTPSPLAKKSWFFKSQNYRAADEKHKEKTSPLRFAQQQAHARPVVAPVRHVVALIGHVVAEISFLFAMQWKQYQHVAMKWKFFHHPKSIPPSPIREGESILVHYLRPLLHFAHSSQYFCCAWSMSTILLRSCTHALCMNPSNICAYSACAQDINFAIENPRAASA